LVLRGLSVLILFSLIGMGLRLLPGGDTLTVLFQLFIGIVLQAGWFLFCLRVVRDGRPGPAVLFEPFNRFGQVWLVSIVSAMMIILGLFLLIIPGLYLWSRFGMGIFASVDRKLDFIEALGFSSKITEGHRLQILLLYLLLGAVGVLLMIPGILEMEPLGMISLLVYMFIVSPLSAMAYASAYDSLVETRDLDAE
jgi:hypothetical protein